MLQQGRVVRSWTYYIIRKDSYLLQNVSVQDLRHDLDHYMIMGGLCAAA